MYEYYLLEVVDTTINKIIYRSALITYTVLEELINGFLDENDPMTIEFNIQVKWYEKPI